MFETKASRQDDHDVSHRSCLVIPHEGIHEEGIVLLWDASHQGKQDVVPEGVGQLDCGLNLVRVGADEEPLVDGGLVVVAVVCQACILYCQHLMLQLFC